MTAGITPQLPQVGAVTINPPQHFFGNCKGIGKCKRPSLHGPLYPWAFVLKDVASPAPDEEAPAGRLRFQALSEWLA
jgi:hypothetical protein